MQKIRIIYLVIALVLCGGFATAGLTGFSLWSMFSVTTWKHKGPPGVHPPVIIFHK